MAGDIVEYRYEAGTRQRAGLLAALAGVLCISLIGGLALRWAELGWGTRGLGLALLVMLLFTVRSQLGRALYRCQVTPDALRIAAPLSNRVVPWAAIVEVRRLKLPQLSGSARWACTVLMQGRPATPTPIYLFDNQLADADALLDTIVRRTPQAQHLVS